MRRQGSTGTGFSSCMESFKLRKFRWHLEFVTLLSKKLKFAFRILFTVFYCIPVTTDSNVFNPFTKRYNLNLFKVLRCYLFKVLGWFFDMSLAIEIIWGKKYFPTAIAASPIKPYSTGMMRSYCRMVTVCMESMRGELLFQKFQQTRLTKFYFSLIFFNFFKLASFFLLLFQAFHNNGSDFVTKLTWRKNS